MTKLGKTGGKLGGKADQRAARKTRLAAALRENLKRRKQQARTRAAESKGTMSAAPKEPPGN
jgi:hypothetical protein